MNWRNIIQSNGIDNSFLTGKHTPCPLCGGKDRFRFDDKGKGMYYCNQCGAGDGYSLIMKFTGMSFKDVSEKIGDVPKMTEIPKPDYTKNLQKFKALVSRFQPIKGTEVETYLKSRGLNDKTIHDAKSLFYVRNLDRWKDNRRTQHDGMVAGVRNDNPTTLHRTYLQGGKKIDRKLMPVIADNKGSAIRLYDYNDILGIAEGIETAMSCYQIYKIPTWAVISTAGMMGFKPPSKEVSLVIFADNDENFAGQVSAYTKAKELKQAGYDVQVILPPNKGDDFNDILLNKSCK